MGQLVIHRAFFRLKHFSRAINFYTGDFVNILGGISRLADSKWPSKQPFLLVIEISEKMCLMCASCTWCAWCVHIKYWSFSDLKKLTFSFIILFSEQKWTKMANPKLKWNFLKNSHILRKMHQKWLFWDWTIFISKMSENRSFWAL